MLTWIDSETACAFYVAREGYGEFRLSQAGPFLSPLDRAASPVSAGPIFSPTPFDLRDLRCALYASR